MTGNVETLHDLGDGLGLLYTATIGRVGYENDGDLLTETMDELGRLTDMMSSRLRPPANTARGAACAKDGLSTFGEVTTDIAALERAATIADRIASSMRFIRNYLEGGGHDYATLVVWLLDGVLDWACTCLSWGVTR